MAVGRVRLSPSSLPDYGPLCPVLVIWHKVGASGTAEDRAIWTSTPYQVWFFLQMERSPTARSFRLGISELAVGGELGGLRRATRSGQPFGDEAFKKEMHAQRAVLWAKGAGDQAPGREVAVLRARS